MSTTFNGSETYPGCGYTLSQLLHAAKRKLCDTAFGGRCVRNRSRGMSKSVKVLKRDSLRIATTVNQVEVKQGGIETFDMCATVHAR